MTNNLFSLITAAGLICAASAAASENYASPNDQPVTVACVGDSITYGARLEDPAHTAYPAILQELLGAHYQVSNLGVGGCTLIREGRPTVWDQLDRIRAVDPDIIVISLGTNDTCGGNRKCWDHKGEFAGDYRDLLDLLLALPSHPQIWICAPTPMVLETPGLTDARKEDLEERRPRLQELIAAIRDIAEAKNVGFIDLNTPLAGKPELFTEGDGVHPNEAGHRAIAALVFAAIQVPATSASATPRDRSVEAHE